MNTGDVLGYVRATLRSAGDTMTERQAIDLAMALMDGLRPERHAEPAQPSRRLHTAQGIVDAAVGVVESLRISGIEPRAGAVILKLALDLMCRTNGIAPEEVPSCDVSMHEGPCEVCGGTHTHGHGTVTTVVAETVGAEEEVEHIEIRNATSCPICGSTEDHTHVFPRDEGERH